MELVDQVEANYDEKILDMKAKVEAMWVESQSKRERRTVACGGVTGVSFFGDNIGIPQIYYILLIISKLTFSRRKSC